jgi:integrase
VAVYPNGTKFWCKFEHRGKLHRFPTDVYITEPDAKRRAKEAETLKRAEVLGREGPGGKGYASQVSLAVLEGLDVLRSQAEGMGPLNKRDLKYRWAFLQKHLGGEHRMVETLTLNDIRDYETARRQEKAKGQTIVRERQALVRALKLAVEGGLLLRMPFEAALLRPIKRSPKHPRRKGVLHPQSHIDLVLSKVSKKAVTCGHVDMCRFVMATGLRDSELRQAGSFAVTRTEWGGILHVRTAKKTTRHTEDRDIPMGPEVLALYDKWRHRFATNDVADSLTLASGRASVVRGVTLRDLRKFYGSKISKGKGGLAAAQKLLGHANISTTAIYVDALSEDLIQAGLAGSS